MQEWSRYWRRSRISFPIAVLCSLMLLLVSEVSYVRSLDVARDLDNAIDARILNQRILRTVLDAETDSAVI